MNENIPRSTRKGRTRRLAQYGVAALMLIVGVLLMLRSDRRESPEHHARRLSKEHGVTVSFGAPSTFYTPPHTQAIPNSTMFEVRPADREAAAVALTAVEQSLKFYPPGFVAKRVHAIFICGDMYMDGVPAGGNTGPLWIILAAPKALGSEGIYNTSLLGIHHELSSFVLRGDPALATTWESFSPPSWKYVASGSEGLKRGEGSAPDLSTGFLSAYGGTTMENDFNTYAEQIFTEPSVLIEKAERYALVGKKLRFVLSAYVKSDGRMRDVFVRLGFERFLGER